MRGTRVDRGDATRMAGAPHLDEVQGLAAAHLADDHAVRPQSHRGAHQFGHGHHACTGAQRHVVARRALQFHCVFQHQHAVASAGDLGQQRVGERGLAGAGTAGDQDVLALAHRAAQELGLFRTQNAVAHVVGQADHTDGALAQGEGRPWRRWRQDALEALARLRQLGGQQGPAAMHLCADMRRDQADDAFAVRGGQRLAGGSAARGEAVDPQRAVRVQHHFHHVRVFERGGDQRSHRRAQHANAPIQRSDRGRWLLRNGTHTAASRARSCASASAAVSSSRCVSGWISS